MDADNKYDITLLLGPLYHLYNKEDKQQALREAIRVTRQGGVIFAAYVISDGCLLDEGLDLKTSMIIIKMFLAKNVHSAEKLHMILKSVKDWK